MLSRIVAGCICIAGFVLPACSSEIERLPVATPQSTPEGAEATLTAVAPIFTMTSSPATMTLLPTPMPAEVISPENLKQVRLLHQYWPAVATAAGVDPYEMDISAAALSPDGRFLAVGGCSTQLEEDLRSGNVYCGGTAPESTGGVPFLLILDADTEEVIARLPKNEAGTTIADLAFAPNGEKLIYAIRPGEIAVWDIGQAAVEAILWEEDTSAPRIAVSSDSRWIAFKTTDRVHIWDTANQELVAEIPAYFRPQFSADGERILVYRNQEFVVYESGTWIEVLSFGMPCDCVYAVSPDLSLLATSARGPEEGAFIVIWDTSSGVQLQTLQAGRGLTAFLAFSPDGSMLWRADHRGDVLAWDTREWNFLAENIGGIIPIFNLQRFQFASGGRYYLLRSDLLLGLYGLP